MLRVKVVVSGMSVSLKGNASVLKTGKMSEGHVQVCLEINTMMIILVKAGFTYYQWCGQMLVNDIFITNMPIFMDSLLWPNKHNSNFQQLPCTTSKIETFTLYSIVQNLMIIISAKQCVNLFLMREQVKGLQVEKRTFLTQLLYR